MAEIIVFAIFMVCWKGLDTLYSVLQLYYSAKIELNKAPETEEEEKPAIGFIDYGDKRRKIEEDYDEEE